MTKPMLIVVCGAPASGKTTLARRLATDLQLPLIEKDTIKESLASVMQPEDREASKRLGIASFRLLYDLAGTILDRGVDLMIEANLNPQFAASELDRLETASRVLIVQCEAATEVIERRYRDRHASGVRHVAHFDLDALPDLLAGLEGGDYDLTRLEFPVITINTDDGYDPPYEEIVSTVERFRADA